MVREEFKGRAQVVYFKSEKDRGVWQDAAKEAGSPVSKFILEMAALGRDKRALPRENSKDAAKLREEVVRLRSRNKDLETILENYEAELLKLRHKAFLQPRSTGSREYSRALVDLLQSGGTWSGKEILKALHISALDSEAVEIILGQLQGLKTYGLVEEDIRGWRWLGRGRPDSSV